MIKYPSVDNGAPDDSRPRRVASRRDCRSARPPNRSSDGSNIVARGVLVDAFLAKPALTAVLVVHALPLSRCAARRGSSVAGPQHPSHSRARAKISAWGSSIDSSAATSTPSRRRRLRRSAPEHHPAVQRHRAPGARAAARWNVDRPDAVDARTCGHRRQQHRRSRRARRRVAGGLMVTKIDDLQKRWDRPRLRARAAPDSAAHVGRCAHDSAAGCFAAAAVR